ncbi:MAG TPA: cyanophycin synthetase, partial [Hyphomicrobiaceae bacterium]|nr:cyanophycin synthetase [Hyphomicrobiaceae bacterium]
GVVEIRMPLLGDYQAANALLAAGLVIAAGEQAGRVLPALAGLKGVKGRLEIVGEVRGGLIVIDYAHKPDALAAALAALRQSVPGRIVCVLGCGGDRDKGKRPIMGRIAAENANHVIVTDDNPRSERPEVIRREILAGAAGAREIGDRAEAIRAGARLLGPGDVLLIAGKGHETGQIVGEVRGGLIVIDYAHKPDALAAALGALRQSVPGRIVCVFGCGGDRDKGKRPIMGRIAAENANHVIVTDDNPRSERPEVIRREILAGAAGAREIGDRAEAIRAGARLLGPGDVLLIAGKGHETGQIVGSTVIPFSDHDAVRAALSEAPIHA